MYICSCILLADCVNKVSSMFYTELLYSGRKIILDTQINKKYQVFQTFPKHRRTLKDITHKVLNESVCSGSPLQMILTIFIYDFEFPV